MMPKPTRNRCTRKISHPNTYNHIHLQQIRTRTRLASHFNLRVITTASQIRKGQIMGKSRMEKKLSILREVRKRCMGGQRVSMRIYRLWLKMWEIKGRWPRGIKMSLKLGRNRGKPISPYWITVIIIKSKQKRHWLTGSHLTPLNHEIPQKSFRLY